VQTVEEGEAFSLNCVNKLICKADVRGEKLVEIKRARY